MGSEEFPRWDPPSHLQGCSDLIQPVRCAPVAVGGDIIEVVAPFKADTTAGRLLKKRGDGGYMIIMQTSDAATRRRYIEEKGFAKVIFSHSHGDVECFQYHPKGIAGRPVTRCFSQED